MKQFRKRMLLTGLAVSVVLGTTAPTVKVFANQQTISNTSVTDVSDSHWAKKQIDAFIKEGIIQGYPDKTFKPSNKITRAEFVRIVNRAFGFMDKGTQSFKDVKADAWYTEDIQIAVKKGYINGFEDNTFRPNEEITREQMAKILGMVLNVSGDGKTNFLDDAKIASWAKKYVDGLAEKGIIEGYTDKTFKPKDNATRAESVRLIADSRDSKNDSNDSWYPLPGGGTVEETISGEVSAEDLAEKFNNDTDGVVTVDGKGATFIEPVKIPEGKTLKVENGAQITVVDKATITIENGATVDLGKGTMELNGTMSLENGGTLSTLSEGVSKFTKDIRNNDAKITGNGVITLGNGTMYVSNLAEVEAKIDNVTVNSKLSVGEKDSWILNASVGEKSTLTLSDNGNLSFEFGGTHEKLGKIHYVTVKSGELTFNDTYRFIVVKSGKQGVKVNLNTKMSTPNGDVSKVEVGYLYNKDAQYGYDIGYAKTSYTGNADGTWTKVVKEQIVNITSNVTTNSTVTTDGTIKLDVTTSGTTTGETTKVLIDGEEANGQTFDLKNTNGLTLTVETAQGKKVNQLVINGKEVELPETLDNGAIITVTLTKEDLQKLVGKDGKELNITVVTN